MVHHALYAPNALYCMAQEEFPTDPSLELAEPAVNNTIRLTCMWLPYSGIDTGKAYKQKQAVEPPNSSN